jgi:hypothetical protein
MTDHPSTDQLSFETDIKPLFRADDREAMQSRFDLWSYDDVSRSADDILGVVANGTMPCDGPWPEGQVARLRQWIESGKPK